jgi:hyperosmotically inducible periplasmic protein
MNLRHLSVLTLSALVLAAASGCAVMRDQQSVGAYVDDTAITTAVKARFLQSEVVDMSSIGVETLNGTVMLSGFAKHRAEKVAAEQMTWRVAGVKQVKNEIAVRP